MTHYKHMARNCKDFEESRFKPGFTSPKYDGVRAFYYPGEHLLASRQNKPIRGMEHIVDSLRHFPYPIDMELFIPDMEFNKLSGIVRNHDSTPEAQARVIDVPSPGNLKDRLLRRKLIITPENMRFIENIPHYWVDAIDKFWEWHKRFLELDLEGSVYKTLDHEYTNQRNWHWMREVPVKSEDCEVLGVYEGNGKMEGIAGGIWINFNGIECKCGTMKGLDYAARKELLDNEDSYIGLVAEIQFKNLQPSGKPRQPRFKGWRYDKEVE